jgi:ferritin-like metal-binding protein YciE
MKQKSTASRTRGRKPSAGNSQTDHRAGSRQSAAKGRQSDANSRQSGSNGSQSDAGRKQSDTVNRQSDAASRQSDASNRQSGAANRQSDNTGRQSAGREENDIRGNQSSARQRNSRSFKGESPLERFFLAMLKDIYYAEKKIVQSLPKMEAATTTEELKNAFEDHLHQTQRHVKRLEKVFEVLGQKAEGEKCEAIEGIAREVENIIGETEDGTMTRDAALIIAAQKVEHYEIATYGGLVQLAITMDLHEAADLLDKTLVEEEDTDARLTEIAENEINLRAEHEGSQGDWQQEEGREEEDEEGEKE